MAWIGLLSNVTSGRQRLLVLLNFVLGVTIGLFVTVFIPLMGTYDAGVAMMHQYGQGLIRNASMHDVTTPSTLRTGGRLGNVTPGPNVLPLRTGNPPPSVHVFPTRLPESTTANAFTLATGPVLLEDTTFHKDDVTVAEALVKHVRVLCWVMTQPANHQTKAKVVKETWGKRCNLLLFVSETSDATLPSIGLDVESGREHLTAKTMQAFDFVYKHYIDQFDWFMKADDDTYVIVENMRYMLSSHSPEDLIYFGHHFYSKTWTDMPHGYFSGGGGYVLSRGALREFGRRAPGLCASDKGSEDVEIGYCMQRLNVLAGDSRDSMGRSRFHCFSPSSHIQGKYPKWYFTFDKYGAPKGIANMSDYAISFHYIPPSMMWMLEFYVYHLRPFGMASGPQELNKMNTHVATGS